MARPAVGLERPVVFHSLSTWHKDSFLTRHLPSTLLARAQYTHANGRFTIFIDFTDIFTQHCPLFLSTTLPTIMQPVYALTCSGLMAPTDATLVVLACFGIESPIDFVRRPSIIHTHSAQLPPSSIFASQRTKSVNVFQLASFFYLYHYPHSPPVPAPPHHHYNRHN
jgi:hypothetical protein